MKLKSLLFVVLTYHVNSFAVEPQQASSQADELIVGSWIGELDNENQIIELKPNGWFTWYFGCKVGAAQQVNVKKLYGAWSTAEGNAIKFITNSGNMRPTIEAKVNIVGNMMSLSNSAGEVNKLTRLDTPIPLNCKQPGNTNELPSANDDAELSKVMSKAEQGIKRGCQLSAAREGIAAEKMEKQCACIVNTFHTDLTRAEWFDFAKYIALNDQPSVHKIVSRLEPKLAACNSY